MALTRAQLGIYSHPTVGERSEELKRLWVRREICSGCRACEVACVAFNEGGFGTAASRIHVTKIEALGIDQPHVCRLCDRAPCVIACPTGALYRDGTTGAVLLNADVCIGCAECVDACPFGVVTLHPRIGQPLICDLCAGDPACVKRCATGALMFDEANSAAQNRRERLSGDGFAE
jgi:Fe-S-cluster-containing hydrogenase component 2